MNIVFICVYVCVCGIINFVLISYVYYNYTINNKTIFLARAYSLQFQFRWNWNKIENLSRWIAMCVFISTSNNKIRLCQLLTNSFYPTLPYLPFSFLFPFLFHTYHSLVARCCVNIFFFFCEKTQKKCRNKNISTNIRHWRLYFSNFCALFVRKRMKINEGKETFIFPLN